LSLNLSVASWSAERGEDGGKEPGDTSSSAAVVCRIAGGGLNNPAS